MEMALVTGPIFDVTKIPPFFDVKTAPLIGAETTLHRAHYMWTEMTQPI